MSNESKQVITDTLFFFSLIRVLKLSIPEKNKKSVQKKIAGPRKKTSINSRESALWAW